MKIFARYEWGTKSLYMGSPELSKHDEFHQFLKRHSFMDNIPNKWWIHIVPGDEYTIAKDRENNVFFVKRYDVLFPLSCLLRIQSQREKFAELFYDFEYVKDEV